MTRTDTVLSDPEKKQVYDQFGEEGLQGGGGGGPGGGMHVDPRELFKKMFGAMGGMGGGDGSTFSFNFALAITCAMVRV